MNNQLILKLIKYNNGNVPDIIYDNILLDKNVASELSKSFVNILSYSQNLTTNKHLRLSVLQNLRKLCQTEPENHLKINDDVIALINETYKKGLNQHSLPSENVLDHKLNRFLSTHIEDLKIRNVSVQNAEVILALMNLNSNHIADNIDIFNEVEWSCGKSLNIIRQIWNEESLINLPNGVVNNMAILMKRNIEQEILSIVLKRLSPNSQDSLLTTINRLFLISSVSSTCFQTCIEVLNLVLIKSKFDCKIQDFIKNFIIQVRSKSDNFVQLYPLNLQSLVLLLDVDEFDTLQPYMNDYIDSTINILHNLKDSSNNLIMILSHFPVWFEHYYNKYGT